MTGDRYAIHGAEGEFEPGSDGRVLRNRLGIVDPEEMEEAESEALVKASVQIQAAQSADHRFTAEDVRYIHRLWLGEIYASAGEYRMVNLSKGGFPFAAAEFIPQLMAELEDGPLATYTPCRFPGITEQAMALAVTHAELILIHPFREGNGRCARLLAHAMALQAGYAGLDFGPLIEEGDEYIRAIHAAMDREYAPMESLFVRVLERSAA